MIETTITIAGIMYPVVSDIHAYIIKLNGYENTKRLVNARYIEDSGLKDAWEAQGYQLRWTPPVNVASRELDGYQVLYGIDEQKKEVFTLHLKGGSVLMGKDDNYLNDTSTEHMKPKQKDSNSIGTLHLSYRDKFYSHLLKLKDRFFKMIK